MGCRKGKMAIPAHSGLRERADGARLTTLPAIDAKPETPSLAKDLQVLTKLRLNTFVLITTFFGFYLAAKGVGGMADKWWLLLHTLIGTAASAFGSAAFNQLMEIEDDARMLRTSDRPLPSRRMSVMKAFGIGWGLAAFGVIHLAAKVNAEAAILAAATIAIYVFVYTPMKKWHSTNTLVGAIPGAIPPLIGWVGAGGDWMAWGGWFLFWLLFFWQLPHFVAISWLCREEYEEAGYQMWSNGDVKGRKTSVLFVAFSISLMSLVISGSATGLFPWWVAVAHTALVIYLMRPILSYRASGERAPMRKAFLGTLLYLPLVLVGLAFAWT
ncbi:heme o synthase [Akkermansiaceae bacterium]|nr:heme o synthase [Akkermansiaceae bacterium]